MESIDKHIKKDREILEDPTISPQTRRHLQSELNDLENYREGHPNDDHDPTAFEMYCDKYPESDECRIYEV